MITKNWIRNINKSPDEKLRILTFPTHERYETNLAKTGHKFFSFQHPKLKKWDKTTVLPDNYYLLNSLYPSDDYDLILAQSRFGQFQLAQEINQHLRIPIISLEHTTITPNFSYNDVMAFGQMQGDVNVFISNDSANVWNSVGISRNLNVIEHCVNSDLFAPSKTLKKKNYVLTVANQFQSRDYCLNYTGWKNITSNIPYKLVGDNPGLSLPSVGVKKLVEEYNQCSVYLNTTTFSPIPMSLLEAMSCGCAVVSTATCDIPNVIEHGVNGLISNNEEELKEYCNRLLNDEPYARQLGEEARKTIINRFSIERFVKEWNEIFRKTKEASI
jgi:glycosyltransferase involved in cell wall biosynthesis